jgi:hypothetical protein
MSKIKAAGTTLESAVSSEKELQLVKQNPEIMANETRLQAISSMVTKQQEKTRSARSDSQQEQPKDSAEISESRRYSASNEAISEDDVREWILEMEGKVWESFLEWQPNQDLDLPKQLQELSKLYLTLLEAALKYAEGENLAKQLERLDAILAQKLNLVIQQNLKSLISLLEETGQSTKLDSIQSSLYRQTAGRTISPQAAHALFAQGRPAGSRSAGFFTASSYSEGNIMHPSSEKQNLRFQQASHVQQNSWNEPIPKKNGPMGSSRNSITREGMIYQSSGKQNIRFQQAFHTQQNSWKEQLRQRSEIISNSRKGIAENTFKQGSVVFCSGKELEKANRFAAHINGSGNLFKNPGISARNDEVTGLLAAIMSIKGDVYAKGSKQGSSITFALENAIEKIIGQYLNRKEASKVYYHTLSAYKQLQNPQKAIQHGQDYAYQQFRKKQGDPAYQKSPYYSREFGFFRTMQKGQSPEKGFNIGVNILQKDWQSFLYAIGNRQSSSYLSRAETYSPWGILAGTKAHQTGSDETVHKILLGAAVTIIICVLAVIYFYFI